MLLSHISSSELGQPFFFSWPTPGRTSPHPLLQFSSPYQTLLSDPKKCYVRHNPNLMNLEGKLQYYQETSLSCKRVRERKKEKTWQKDMVRSSGVPVSFRNTLLIRIFLIYKYVRICRVETVRMRKVFRLPTPAHNCPCAVWPPWDHTAIWTKEFVVFI